MSNKIYQNQLIEQIKKAYIGSILEELGPSDAATLQEQEREQVGVFSDKTKGEEAGEEPSEEAQRAKEKGFLDVQAIVAKLTSKSSGEGKGGVKQHFSAEEAISIIKERVYRGKGLSDDSSVEEIHRHFVGFLQPLEPSTNNLKDEPCTDIQTLATRALVNSAYYNLMTEQAADATGKINEVFLANLVGGTPIKIFSNLKGADPSINNIADFKVGKLYFSLKTKTADRDFGGSVKDLLATLGIPYLYKTEKAEFFSARKDPIGRFFLLFFGKPTRQRKEGGSAAFFSFTTVEVKKEDIINLLKGKTHGTISLNEFLTKRKDELVKLIVNYFRDSTNGNNPERRKMRYRIQKMSERIPGFQGLGRNKFIEKRDSIGEEGLYELVFKHLDAILEGEIFHPDKFVNPSIDEVNSSENRLIKGKDEGVNDMMDETHGKPIRGRNRKYSAAWVRYEETSKAKLSLESQDQTLLLIDDESAELVKEILNLTPNTIGSGKTKPPVEEGQWKIQEINFKANRKLLEDQSKKLGSQLTYSLNLINEYFMSIEKTVLEYASRPSQANLEAFQAKASEISKESITTIDGLFRCKDENPLDKPS